MPDWIAEYRELIITTGASLGLLVLCTVAVGIVLVRIPAEYFQREHRGRRGWGLVRNIAGWLLIVAGLAMLVLPGPGILVVLIGVMLAEFPGKDRVQKWIISRKGVLKAANGLRRRFGKPPLKINT